MLGIGPFAWDTIDRMHCNFHPHIEHVACLYSEFAVTTQGKGTACQKHIPPSQQYKYKGEYMCVYGRVLTATTLLRLCGVKGESVGPILRVGVLDAW